MEMSHAIDDTVEHADVTRLLAANSSGLKIENLPDEVIFVAKQCILDWLGVTIAGAADPLVGILRDSAAADGGHQHATLIGGPGKVSVRQAALINGAAGHALDYDDVLRPLGGHPTAPIMPAVLALAERDGLSGAALLTAFVAGLETEARVGLFVGDSHYAAGWHATATIGTFGAAAGSASLMGLDADQTAMALGIAATQAAGLKSMFGTMCKPLHAGKASENGLLAADLASRGFTSRSDALECFQGFGFTQSETVSATAALEDLGALFYAPRTQFKYHAACYGTHSPIEAARKARLNASFNPGNVEKIELKVHPRCLSVCNIPEPETGLEVKFSLRHTTALSLSDAPTGDMNLYSVATATDPEYVALRRKVTVSGDPDLNRNGSEILVHQSDGTVIREVADLTEPDSNFEATWRRLQDKFRAITAPVVGDDKSETIIRLVDSLESQDGVASLTAACTPTA
ncbi:MAG: 2-methylcitrate dehydratase PrpD [Alphaproteobacteria bacterium]|jgi:2-methylcitrate dehydratase PrpD